MDLPGVTGAETSDIDAFSRDETKPALLLRFSTGSEESLMSIIEIELYICKLC